MHEQAIKIIGANQHNLKNLNVEIPLHRLVAVTGVSGSGKSSLAFDTLYAEGQRRYVETFSPYARQFMERMDRPMVDRIEGVPPAIAIDRKDPVRTSRSTVGTMTEITDYVKLLYARLGQLHCRTCGRPVVRETPEMVWDRLLKYPEGSQVIVTFPKATNGSPMDQVLGSLRQMGFVRHLIGWEIHPLEEYGGDGGADTIQVVVDRLLLRVSDRKRILDSLEQSFRFGKGRLDLWIVPKGSTSKGRPRRRQHLAFSSSLECARCHISYRDPMPSLFSFNSPIGACQTCRGFGRVIDMDLDLIIPNSNLSLEEGAIKPWGAASDQRMEFQDLMDFCRTAKIPTDVPFRRLPRMQKEKIIQGTDSYYGIRGFFNWLEGKTYKMHVRVFLSRYRSYEVCPECKGSRFTEEPLLYRLGDLTIAQVYQRNVQEVGAFFHTLRIPERDEASRLIMDEVRGRLKYLLDVGLGYLTLDRQSRTLSGGEVQRVALASALGASLVNTLYVLDEPSIGLHPRDNQRLVQILKQLRDLNNTVVVVEHDPEIISQSDIMLDLGPSAGEEGGRIMYFGPTGNAKDSVTGEYMVGKRFIPLPRKRRKPDPKRQIRVEGASEHNLKKIDVSIPLGLFVCVTGVSGSGKSTLVEEIFFKGIKWGKGDPQGRPGLHRTIKGLGLVDDVTLVDQRPIGRTPRANPATYTKAMDFIRKLLAEKPEAHAAGLTATHFSFNTDPGRCKTCRGEGFEKVEMQFLSDVFVTCPECRGKRFESQVLLVTHKEKNIDDILSMTVDQALAFFRGELGIEAALSPLSRVGLGYLRLGQPINTLSGGEAQRLKLSGLVRDRGNERSILFFDEPTTGLHMDDIRLLLEVFQDLVGQGNTVVVIEHNMDVIKGADWVIDLGPEGGEEGGRIVAEGPPEEVARHRSSHTGRFLQKYLQGNRRLMRAKRYSRLDPPRRRSPEVISVRGAREHNLKNLSLDLPRNQMVVLTGVSGSGKSTLAFDILFAEGQRRYLEGLAPYVRQYVRVLERPEVDMVTGLPPSVAIEQRMSAASRRSTVATLTEIYHFMRLLYSKVGVQHCPGCGRPMTAQSRESVIAGIRNRYRNRSGLLLAPKVMARKGFHKDVLARALRKGYREARIDGTVTALKEGMALSRYHEHTIELVVGRVPSKKADTLAARALEEGDGNVVVVDPDGVEEIFSARGICPSCGLGLPELDPRLFSFNSKYGACPSCEGLGRVGDWETRQTKPCPSCKGSRLTPEALSVTVLGYSIWDLVRQPVSRVSQLMEEFRFEASERPVTNPIMSEIRTRLALLSRLGLSYLSLSRSGATLSGGESQRVRLASQLGSNLTGVCYILDEPTIGLHPRDNSCLLEALTELRDRGNTILVVEHDEETIRNADTIIDLGPGAGQGGGRVVAMGKLSDLQKVPESVTGTCFNGNPHRITSQLRPYEDRPKIILRGARANNLKSIDAAFPLGTLIAVTGVSGSGKSTLLKETLYKALRNQLSKQQQKAIPCRGIEGWQQVDRVLEVDHSPIGRTPRSIPASYVGFLSDIRNLFAGTPEARARGYKAGRFSFNLKGGRCEVCQGQGSSRVAMSFLPDVYVHCEVCGGLRFSQETLSVTYGGKTISEVLDLTFDEARSFFGAVPRIRRAVQFVCDIGLGYLRLGQPSPTLSGGEAQRIKLAQELAKPSHGRTFYVLDEPTTGLHLADVKKLVQVLQALVGRSNTVAVIEHNMEIIKEADYIIDLGPEGGEEGGTVVAEGSPLELLGNTNGSYTGQYLKRYLGTS